MVNWITTIRITSTVPSKRYDGLYDEDRCPKDKKTLRKYFENDWYGFFILMYLRVADVGDPWSLCVTPQHFSEHLEVLQNSARTFADQLTQYLRHRKIPRRSGHNSLTMAMQIILHTAKPLLERGTTSLQRSFLQRAALNDVESLVGRTSTGILSAARHIARDTQLSIRGKIYEWHLNNGCTIQRRYCSPE